MWNSYGFYWNILVLYVIVDTVGMDTDRDGTIDTVIDNKKV